MISAAWLIRATGCTRAAALTYAPWLDEAAHRWAIDTPTRVAAWIAQLAYESQRFTRVEENLYYTTAARLIAVWPSRFRLPARESEDALDQFDDGRRNARRYLRDPGKLANFVYAGRMGNGDEGSGDGHRYRGRGLIQLTGHDNYAAYAADTTYPVLSMPDLLLQPFGAADSAAWFWHKNRLNALADTGDWHSITRTVSGSTRTAADRERMTLAGLTAASGAIA